MKIDIEDPVEFEKQDSAQTVSQPDKGSDASSC